MLLEIQIPTILGREETCERLVRKITSQIKSINQVGIKIMKDNRELSIGMKRQKLVEECTAEYLVQIDDDDDIPDCYVEEILLALESKPDCIGYIESVTINNNRLLACHSNRFDDWSENQLGFHFIRTIFCKDVIKTSIAREVGFSDMRFGEDHDFARKLKASGLLKNEVFINKIMYYYSHNSLTSQQHKERYGL